MHGQEQSSSGVLDRVGRGGGGRLKRRRNQPWYRFSFRHGEPKMLSKVRNCGFWPVSARAGVWFWLRGRFSSPNMFPNYESIPFSIRYAIREWKLWHVVENRMALAYKWFWMSIFDIEYRIQGIVYCVWPFHRNVRLQLIFSIKFFLADATYVIVNKWYNRLKTIFFFISFIHVPTLCMFRKATKTSYK